LCCLFVWLFGRKNKKQNQNRKTKNNILHLGVSSFELYILTAADKGCYTCNSCNRLCCSSCSSSASRYAFGRGRQAGRERKGGKGGVDVNGGVNSALAASTGRNSRKKKSDVAVLEGEEE
jgi:hypothetical protein